MSQYRARDGCASQWHLVHLGRFAMGGAGLVFAEATAVEARGRRTHGDLGLWEDRQVESLLPITRFLCAEGAVPGIQLGHAGRKASERRPWHGETPVTAKDEALRSESPWPVIAPSPVAYADGWPTPAEMTEGDIAEVLAAFGAAAGRAADAGFRVLEVYGAHGFLIHQFLSPLANRRADKWGEGAAGRRRFAVEVARSIRTRWPAEFPLVFRLSVSDWVEGGIEPEVAVDTAQALAEEGVDMIDCSSGGIGGRERPRRMKLDHGFQIPFAAQIRRDAAVATMTVGMLWDAESLRGRDRRREGRYSGSRTRVAGRPELATSCGSPVGSRHRSPHVAGGGGLVAKETRSLDREARASLICIARAPVSRDPGT